LQITLKIFRLEVLMCRPIWNARKAESLRLCGVIFSQVRNVHVRSER
jgi:hypothetical protein